MRRFLHPNILVPTIAGLILFILLPILYFTGIIGSNDTKKPDPTVDSSISAEAEPSEENKELEVEEETFLLEVEKEIEEAQKNNPDAYPQPEASHEHEYNTTVISPSCNREGYTLYSCECGDTYKDDVKDKLSHSYTSKVIAPTTTSGGYTLYTCSICGNDYKDNYTDPVKAEPEETKPTEPKPTEPPQPETPEYNENPGASDLKDPNHEDNDHGACPKCGRNLWTYWDQTGCFTFLVDSTCDCGVFVKAGECHHH